MGKVAVPDPPNVCDQIRGSRLAVIGVAENTHGLRRAIRTNGNRRSRRVHIFQFGREYLAQCRARRQRLEEIGRENTSSARIGIPLNGNQYLVQIKFAVARIDQLCDKMAGRLVAQNKGVASCVDDGLRRVCQPKQA